jgi:hypothetical protein
MWIGFIWFCARAIIGYCKYDNKSSESIKCGDLDSVNCYEVLKKNSVPWS